VTAKQVIAVLRKRGFSLARSTGSHHIFRNPSGVRVTVPVHSGRIIHPKVIGRILKDAGMTVEELVKELK
jgi:predicted RNA binding protein YcfA (HicA-like mRNA interferase family)